MYKYIKRISKIFGGKVYEFDNKNMKFLGEIRKGGKFLEKQRRQIE